MKRNVIKNIIATVLALFLFTQNISLASAINTRELAKQTALLGTQDISELSLTYNLVKLHSIDMYTLGDIQDFSDWLADKDIKYQEVCGYSPKAALKIFIDHYMADAIKALKAGKLENMELDKLEQVYAVGEYKDYIHLALKTGLMTTAGYELADAQGFFRSLWLLNLTEYLPFTIYPAFTYDNTQEKTRNPYADIIYTLKLCGIYNDEYDIKAEEPINNLELLAIIYMIDTGKYEELPEIKDKDNLFYKGINTTVSNEALTWRARNDLIYCLNSIPDKWIVSIKENNWSFEIVEDLNMETTENGSIIGLCSPFSKKISLGADGYASNFGIPEHEIAHYICDVYKLYGPITVLYSVEKDAVGTFVRDYSQVNKEEYFAECFRHIWINQNDPIEVEKFKTKAPLTYHVVWDLIINNKDPEVIADSEFIQDTVADWYIENIGI